jgi:pimeloyl-ACP methyl ester carboxylesterase
VYFIRKRTFYAESENDVSYWFWALVAGLTLLFVGYAYEALQEFRDRRRYPPPGKFVEVAGRRMHVFIQGDARGPSVVIEQGIGSPSIVWWPIQSAIARFARVFSYDRAGFLWSDAATGERSLDDRVADLHAVLQQARVPPPYVLMGHSMGGLLIRRFARLHPESVAGMILVDSPDESVIFRETVMPFYRQGVNMQRVLAVAARFGLLRLIGRYVPMLMLPEDELGYALCVTPRHAAAAADDMRCLLNAVEGARKADAPGSFGDRPLVLLRHGIPFPAMAAVMEEGWAESQQRLAQLSTNSEILVAEKSSHLIYVDEPQLVVDAVRRVHAAARDGVRLVDIDFPPPVTVSGNPIARLNTLGQRA